MNKNIKWRILWLFLFILCGPVEAAFTVSGTRFIYEEGKKNISFDVTNNLTKTYGGQVWVDNISQSDGVYMVPTPPFFRVKPKQKQIVRIMKTDSGMLPTDRESLFWLNIQEIPPKPEAEGSVLAIAINTKVKIFYRPKALIAERKGAEKKIKLTQRGNTLYLKNPTPYYFAVTKVKVGGKTAVLNPDDEQKLSIFDPFSEQPVHGLPVNSTGISIDTINDWGGVENHALSR